MTPEQCQKEADKITEHTFDPLPEPIRSHAYIMIDYFQQAIKIFIETHGNCLTTDELFQVTELAAQIVVTRNKVGFDAYKLASQNPSPTDQRNHSHSKQPSNSHPSDR